MVDYSKLSDFDINKRIAHVLGNAQVNQVYDEIGGSAVQYTIYKSSGLNREGLMSATPCNVKKDFCNNPDDAWQIIVDSKISLHHSICRWYADSIVYDKKYKDGFFIFSSCSDIGDISSRGALRAAMIVFLMMQDAKNG